MTKTTCPTCGARCRQNEMYSECNTSQSLISLPQNFVIQARVDGVIKAVKELLEENKP